MGVISTIGDSRPTRDRAAACSRWMLALLANGLAVSFANGQIAAPQPWGTDGDVNSIVRSGNTIYVGGAFTKVGPSTGGGVPLVGDSGRYVPGFPRVAGTVKAVVSDGEGGWFIGGYFTGVGGELRKDLAHILPDGSVAAWNPEPDLTVLALAVDAGRLYVGGRFSSIAGHRRRSLAAFDAESGALLDWDPSPNGEVQALCAVGDTVLIGGDFDSVGSVPRGYLAAVAAGSGAPMAWDVPANWPVSALATSGGILFVGGYFSQIGGQLRGLIAAVDLGTGAVTEWNPNASGVPPNPYALQYPVVASLAIADSVVFVGGNFVTIGGAPRISLAAVDLRTGQATDWTPAVGPYYVGYSPCAVWQLGFRGDQLLAVGDFMTIDGQDRGGGAAFDKASGALLSWNPRAVAPIYALAIYGDRVYVGGTFSTLGVWQTRHGLAAIDALTGEVTPWDPQLDVFGVGTLAFRASTVYVGGLIFSAGGLPRMNIAAIDSATGLPTSFNPGPNGAVRAIAFAGDTVLVGGRFTTIGGQARSYVAAVDATTGDALPWNANCNDIVSTIAVHGNSVYVGGWFSTIGGQQRSGLACLDAGSGIATAWNPSADSPVVNDIVIVDTTVFVGGDFNYIGGEGRDGIAAIGLHSGVPTAWVANASRQIYCLAASGNTVYAGGGFSSIGGRDRFCVAAIDAHTGIVSSWDPQVDAVVWGLATFGDIVYAGGALRKAGGTPCAGFSSFIGAEPPAPPPAHLALAGVAPNPVVSDAIIRFDMPRASEVSLSVYDIMGRRVASLLDRVPKPAGRQQVAFLPQALRSGCYLYRLEACGTSLTGKMVVLR